MLVEGRATERTDKGEFLHPNPSKLANAVQGVQQHLVNYLRVRMPAENKKSSFTWTTPGNPFFRVTDYPVYSFTVVPGEITYLGNLTFHKTGSKIHTEFQARDLKDFFDNNPKLSSKDIKTNPFKIEKQARKNDPTAFQVKGSISEVSQ